MDRFVAMIWDAVDRGPADLQVARFTQAMERAPCSWETAVDRPGLCVLVAAQTSRSAAHARFDDRSGVVIGRLFRRGQETRGAVASISRDEAAAIRSIKGDRLIHGYWGNYLAIWRSDADGSIVVLRDPCGAVPCFRIRIGEVDILCSHAGDISGFPGFVFEPDWQFLQSFLLFNFFTTRFTGLSGLEELMPGQRMVRSAGGALEFAWAWNPVGIAADPTDQSFGDACEELLETSSDCFAGWGRAYSRILVRLSGGLDSAIALSLLRSRGGAEVTALHMVGSRHDAAELDLARLAAKHAGVRLVEVELSDEDHNLAGMIGVSGLARPTKQVLGLSADNLISAACDAAGADCTVAGHGGDALFIQRSSASHMLDDFVRLRGLGKGFLRRAYHTAMLLEHPVWPIARTALFSTFQQPIRSPYPFLADPSWRSHRLLRRGAIEALPEEYFQHPLLKEAARLAPGKADHLQSILALRNYYAVAGSGLTRDELLPFVAQPIVEFCLRTPTWIFGEGGLDRSLERSAFAKLIPEPIARRTGKGLIDNALIRLIVRNLPSLRELVLDSEIAHQPWLDRVRIDYALTAEKLLRAEGLDDILNVIVTEAWLASWRLHSL